MNLTEVLATDLATLSERDLAPVDVAVLDTGIDATHPDLKDRIGEAFEIVGEEGRYHASARSLPGNHEKFPPAAWNTLPVGASSLHM